MFEWDEAKRPALPVSSDKPIERRIVTVAMLGRRQILFCDLDMAK
jgi:hypothetical protein